MQLLVEDYFCWRHAFCLFLFQVVANYFCWRHVYITLSKTLSVKGELFINLFCFHASCLLILVLMLNFCVKLWFWCYPLVTCYVSKTLWSTFEVTMFSYVVDNRVIFLAFDIKRYLLSTLCVILIWYSKEKSSSHHFLQFNFCFSNDTIDRKWWWIYIMK